MFVVVRAARGRRSGDVILDLAARGLPVCDLCWQQRLAVLRGSRAINSASLREIPHRLMKTEVHYRVHKSLPLDSLLSQINPFQSHRMLRRDQPHSLPRDKPHCLPRDKPQCLPRDKPHCLPRALDCWPPGLPCERGSRSTGL